MYRAIPRSQSGKGQSEQRMADKIFFYLPPRVRTYERKSLKKIVGGGCGGDIAHFHICD